MENKNKIFALVDCNSFYASCERIFRPDLRDKPIAILSNNDGCIVAMTKEAKELGVTRGEPYFKIPADTRKKLTVFSSNYSMYGDISHRVMDILAEFSPESEIYSIDESFLDLTGMNIDLTEYGKEIRKKVKWSTGIPVSVGIGKTKTLAKLANHIAKKREKFNGVVDLSSDENIDKYLAMVKVSSIWGVGRKLSAKLERKNIITAKDLKYTSDGWIQRNLGGVTGMRTVWELRGISCIPLDTIPALNKGIVSSRSFGKSVETLSGLKEAVSSYISIGAKKLRKQKTAASALTVYIKTNRFKDEPQYNNSITYKTPYPTSSTIELTEYALNLLERIYKDGYKYKKAGIMLDGIVPNTAIQYSLFTPDKFNADVDIALDTVNKKWGRNALFTASSGINRKWSMRREFVSPRYTTNWNEILKIRI
ncbi:MAG: Y-family DNA polymerase [Candidatus Delongbacteria bacterium]|jgi:DNA polymerase V|nr:Y-family DNA polymerase [Candidatus Delongbacteria bacterium]